MTRLQAHARRHPWRFLVACYLLLFVGLAAASEWAAIVLLPGASQNAQTLLMEAIRAVPTMAFLVALVGTHDLRLSLRGLGKALRLSAAALAMVAFSMLATIVGIATGVGSSELADMGMTGLASDWPVELLQALLLLLCVGVYEEALFRGILLDTLLGRLGHTRRGLMGAVLVCSLAFGFSHVLPSFMTGDVASADTIAQALLKTLQAGMMGVLFCAVVLRSNNLWDSVVVHALCDAGIVLYSLFGDVSAVSYVSSDAEMGQALVATYVLIAVLALAYFIPALLSLRKVPVPRVGVFADGATIPFEGEGTGFSTPPPPDGITLPPVPPAAR